MGRQRRLGPAQDRGSPHSPTHGPLGSTPASERDDAVLNARLYWLVGQQQHRSEGQEWCVYGGGRRTPAPPSRLQASCLEAQPEHAATDPVIIWKLFNGACGERVGRQGGGTWVVQGHLTRSPLRAAQSSTRQAQSKRVKNIPPGGAEPAPSRSWPLGPTPTHAEVSVTWRVWGIVGGTLAGSQGAAGTVF